MLHSRLRCWTPIRQAAGKNGCRLPQPMSRTCPGSRRHIHCYPPTDYSLMSTIRFASTHRRKPFVPDTPVRTRFAPSPTGYLHLGSLRTALFNYLLARRTGGQFLLRIEDTDQKRTVPDAEQRLMDDLRWAGLEWDEGPGVGGPYGPYRQSERTTLYHAHAEQLIASGHAYRCFCSPERLYQLAGTRHRLGLPTDYDRHCFHLSPEESHEKTHAGEKHVIRLKAPKEYPAFEDLVYGSVNKKLTGAARIPRQDRFPGLDAFDDPILVKSDGQPTYHFANVVDDHHMAITHVIRGTEWLVATPKHIALYEALGWQPPQFAHVGLLVDPQGNKLSKRNLEDIGIETFRDKQGILPETLLNFVALLGWSHDKRKDLMTMEELQDTFTLKFTKGNTVVDTSKMWYMQSRHASRRALQKGRPFEELVDRVLTAVEDRFPEQSYRSILQDRSLEAYVATLLEIDANNYLSATHFVDRNKFFFSPDSFPPVVKPDSAVVSNELLFSAAENIVASEGAESDPEFVWEASQINSRITAEAGRLLQEVTAQTSSQRDKNGADADPTISASPETPSLPIGQNDAPAPTYRQVTAALFHFLRDIFFGGQDGPPAAQSMAFVGRQFCKDRLTAGRKMTNP